MDLIMGDNEREKKQKKETMEEGWEKNKSVLLNKFLLLKQTLTH